MNLTIIKFEELLNIAPKFAGWLKTIVRYGNVDSQALIGLTNRENGFMCKIYTNDHCYSFYG